MRTFVRAGAGWLKAVTIKSDRRGGRSFRTVEKENGAALQHCKDCKLSTVPRPPKLICLAW
jgi:hypothetical protein